MKSTRKLSLSLATFFLFASIIVGSCISSAAAPQAPSKVRVFPKSTAQVVSVMLDNYDDQIKDLKSSSKNLKVVETGLDVEKSEGKTSYHNRYFTLYAKKAGTYKVSFNVVNAAGEKVASKSITVYAKADSPVKSCKLDGKTINGYLTTTKKSGKIKITMNKGYKLKKIEVGTYQKANDGNDMVYKKVKNGAKITLGTKPYEYDYESGSPADNYYYRSWNKGVTAPTQIQITYVDKYTKQESSVVYTLEKLLL